MSSRNNPLVLKSTFPREVKEGLINPISLPIGYPPEKSIEAAKMKGYFITVFGDIYQALLVVKGKAPISIKSFGSPIEGAVNGSISPSAVTSVPYIIDEFLSDPNISSEDAVERARKRYERDYDTSSPGRKVEIDESKFTKFLSFLRSRSPRELSALVDYSFESTLINNQLRGVKPEGHVMDVSDKIDEIYNLFELGPRVTEQLTVYRGFGSEIRESFTDGGFISASIDLKVALTFAGLNTCCLYEIFLNPGDYSILPVWPYGRKEEKEVLLPPGTFLRTGSYIGVFEGEKMRCIQVVYLPPNSKIA